VGVGEVHGDGPGEPHRALLHDAPRDRLPGIFILGLVAPWLAGAAIPGAWFRTGYELFLSLYALPFPAYVWIVCLGWGMPFRRRLWTLAVAVALAAPFFVVGALLKHWLWLPVGVGVVLAAPLVARLTGGGSKRAPEAPGA